MPEDQTTQDHNLDGIIITKGSEIMPEPIEWIWPGWLAKGKCHVLAGEPGRGKTSLCITIAATITTGGHFPDETSPEIGEVVIWSGEDGIADTLIPRCHAAGGDLTKIFFIRGKQEGGIEHPFDPSKDLTKLDDAFLALENPKLLIIDPLVSTFKRDGNNNAETRKDLQPLIDLAVRKNIAVIGIHHLGKPNNQHTSAIHRLNGSVAIGGVARTVFMVDKYQNDDEKSVFVRAKNNNGPTGDGFIYSITGVELPHNIRSSRIEWGDRVLGRPEDLLPAVQSNFDSPGKSKLDESMEFIRARLAEGPVSTAELHADAKAENISLATLRRALQKLGAEYICGREENAGKWYTALPTAYQVGQVAQVGQVEHVAQPNSNEQVEQVT